MATHVYANLAPMGWIDITKDALMSIDKTDPATWYSEGGQLDSRAKSMLHERLDAYPFVHVFYNGKDYRVSPFQIQIVKD